MQSNAGGLCMYWRICSSMSRLCHVVSTIMDLDVRRVRSFPRGWTLEGSSVLFSSQYN
jgi:hypothetical protein